MSFSSVESNILYHSLYHNPTKQLKSKHIGLYLMIKEYQPKPQPNKHKQTVFAISTSFHSLLLCHLVADFLTSRITICCVPSILRQENHLFLVWGAACCTMHPVTVVIYMWQNWGNSIGRNWVSLSLRTLATPLCRGSTVCPCHLLPSIECNDARPCLGNKMLSFLLIIYFRMK